MPRTTVFTPLTHYNRSGSIESEKRSRNQRTALSPKEKQTLLSWVDEDAILTLQQSCDEVKENFYKSISKSTVDRIKTNLH